MIKIKNLYQQFGTKIAVEDVNLNIDNGRIIGLIGPNGSGKSTIIRSIMGILKPTSGGILVDEIPVNRRISKVISYMSDINELYMPTVRDNIIYFTELFDDYDIDLTMSIIKSINIDLDMNVLGLSKGQITIIRFALTVGRKVKYYIFDEPLSGLDPVFRESFIARLKQFHQEFPEKTILITSHLLNEIQGLLDEIIAIYFAKILAEGDKNEILKGNENLESWFKKQYVHAGIEF